MNPMQLFSLSENSIFPEGRKQESTKMGNCTASNLLNEDAVSLCRDRKRLVLSAIGARYALACAHRHYFLSLRSVAGAINSFVLHHSSPLRPSLLVQSASKPSIESNTVTNRVTDERNGDGNGKESREMRCGYDLRDFGWDFFNPFEGVMAADEVSICRSSGEEKELMEEEESEAGICRRSGEEKKLIEEEEEERELLDALRNVEDLFFKAFDCGKEVSKVLEIDLHDQSSDLGGLKENSSKSASRSHPPPSSLSSKDSLSIQSKSKIVDHNGRMAPGSHSQTLGRLYHWEEKLYEEVKGGDHIWQAYKKTCLQLRKQLDAKGADTHSLEKTKSKLTDLYTRILVSFRSIETISIKIQKVRDEELQPQAIDLLQGLLKTWKIMLESHETQKKIMSQVKSFSCPTYGKFCNDSQTQVTIRLETEFQNWRLCFMSYIAAQRSYIEFYSQVSDLANYKSVSLAIKGFIKATRVLWVKQGEQQQQKKRVDSLVKELDRRVLESKLSDIKHNDLIDKLTKKVQVAKVKHQECMKKTQRVTLEGFRIGLLGVFESLTEFCKNSVNLYEKILMCNEKVKVTIETEGKSSRLTG